jgi:uncharacterized membrane protein YcaP (DUF421 family)
MNIDWQSLFVPKTPLLELVLRGTLIYLSLFAVLRFLVRRQLGSLSLMDLLLIVLIADAAQNAMASDYKSIPEGLVLCGTLIGWNYLLDWLAFKSPTLRRWLEPEPLALVRHGRIQRKNLRQELITEEELRSHLREQGVQDLQQVEIAYMEPDGMISVIKSEPSKNDSPSPPRKRRFLR